MAPEWKGIQGKLRIRLHPWQGQLLLGCRQFRLQATGTNKKPHMKKSLLVAASLALLSGPALAQQYTFTNNTDCSFLVEFHYAANCSSNGAGVGMVLPPNSAIHYTLPTSTVLTRVDLKEGGTLLQQWLCTNNYWNLLEPAECHGQNGDPIGEVQRIGRVTWLLDYDIPVGE